MDKDRIAGSAKVVKGKFKAVVGKVAGDAKLEAEGNADQVNRQGSERRRRPEGHAQRQMRDATR